MIFSIARVNVQRVVSLALSLLLVMIVCEVKAGDGKDGDGTDIPNDGRLCVGGWEFQFGPLTGASLNAILLDAAPGSRPPVKATVDISPTRFVQLAVLYTGVAVTGARAGRITVTYDTGNPEDLDSWEIRDWVGPGADRCTVALRGCDWWRSDRGFVTGDDRVCLFAQVFDVDRTRLVESIQFSVEGIGTGGDVGVFALSGRLADKPSQSEQIDLRGAFNFDTVINQDDDDVSGGFRSEHKPQYFATEAASASIRSAPVAGNAPEVASLALPSEIQRTAPDFVVFDPTGGERRTWDEIRLWNEHFLVQEAGDGNLLAFWTSTTKSVGHCRSVDGGVTWTAPSWFEGPAAWQVPVITRSGRIYVFSTHGGFSGGLSCRVSDDHGRTWQAPVELLFPTTELDSGAAQWISCTVPHWDSQGRPLIAYTHWASTAAVPGGTVGITSRYSQVEIFRIENVEEASAPVDLRFTWLNRDAPITVPHETIEGASFAQEPYLVDLPDGRMLMTVRTNRGEAWYTVSRDEGETWRETEPLRYRDGGPIIQQPVAPAALFRLDRGDYLYLFNNNDGYVHGASSRWDVRNRRPAYICRGEFRATAHQPIWWSQPKLFVDNGGVRWRLRLEAAAYVSLTEQRGRRVLWYPDRKGFLLGKHVPDAWLDSLEVPD